MSEKLSFPRVVYKRGTGKALDESGAFEAESAVVNSEEELTALGWDWCKSPADAAAPAKKEPAHVEHKSHAHAKVK